MQKFLKENSMEDYFHSIRNLGVETIDDLPYVTAKMIEKLGMPVFLKEKLKNLIMNEKTKELWKNELNEEKIIKQEANEAILDKLIPKMQHKTGELALKKFTKRTGGDLVHQSTMMKDTETKITNDINISAPQEMTINEASQKLLQNIKQEDAILITKCLCSGKLSLKKMAKRSGGDLYQGTIHDAALKIVHNINVYVPQEISRKKKSQPIDEIFMQLLLKNIDPINRLKEIKSNNASENFILLKLSKAASSTGGDKYEGSFKGSAFIIYIPQCFSRTSDKLLPFKLYDTLICSFKVLNDCKRKYDNPVNPIEVKNEYEAYKKRKEEPIFHKVIKSEKF